MPKRVVHVEELRELGFPEALIQEAKRSEELGLFGMEPSPDLVERIVKRCKDAGLFPEQKEGLLRKLFQRIFRQGSQ